MQMQMQNAKCECKCKCTCKCTSTFKTNANPNANANVKIQMRIQTQTQNVFHTDTLACMLCRLHFRQPPIPPALLCSVVSRTPQLPDLQKLRGRPAFFDRWSCHCQCTNKLAMQHWHNIPFCICKCTNAQMHKCTNAQMHKCANAQMRKCANAQIHATDRCGYNDGNWQWALLASYRCCNLTV